MKQIDQVLKGVIINGFQEINPQLATFKMFVTRVVLNNRNGSKWHFSLPPLISIHLRDYSGLTPEDRYALSITGSVAQVHVTGEPGKLEAKVMSVIGRTRLTLDEFVSNVDNYAPKGSSEVHIDQVLSGVIVNGFKEINPQLATFKVFVAGAELRNRNGAKWHFSLPRLISIHLRDFSGLTPEDRYALSITGSVTQVHVIGEPSDIDAKVVSAVGRTRLTLDEFVSKVDDYAPNCPLKVHIDGDFENQRIRLDS